MTYQPGGRLTFGRLAALAGWTAVVAIFASATLFLFTFGDCAGEMACEANSRRAGNIIIWTTFVIYWAGFITMVRNWSRK
ncbi:MAG: hypothetical protein ABW039_13340 [Sphingobium sp.]